MKKVLQFVFVLLYAMQLCAQEIPSIKVGEDKLGITSLDIQVEVVGNIATTTYDMLFYNPTNTVLEGELAFPLGEGQNVSRLALEVNGKLREAVVVEKELGRVAFEAVVRRGVDPVLLEKGTGNNYKARIYPIPAKGYKRVVLAHEQELILSEDAHSFQLPLGFKKNLDHFALEMQILDQTIAPKLTKGTLENFNFNSKNGNYYAKFEKKNFTPEASLTIKIPQDYNANKVITSSDYFYVYKTIKNTERLRDKSKVITIYWDTSLSMKDRDLEKELAFLDAYVSHLSNVKIKLVKFSNTITLNKDYNIKNGDWDVLKKELLQTTYDGGTSYSSLFFIEKSDEILLFSDGMKNLSDMVINTEQPVYVINSIIKANHSELNSICESTNGKYINLKKKSTKESLTDIQQQSFKFLGFESSNSDLEIYPKKGITVDSDFSIAGKNFKDKDAITLLFGYGNSITERETITINNTIFNRLVQRIWAQKKLDVLQEDSDINKDEIIIHSKQYSLVSNHTSLIVLERVLDYVKYRITPPEELLEEYNRIINRNSKRVVSVQTDQTIETENGDVSSTTSNLSGNITGTIADENGLPLPTATIIIEGTSTGTSTDFDGNYAINASPEDTLIISYVGYGNSAVTVGSGTIINVSLQPDNSLDEVVVTALGMKKEAKAIGYAVERVSSEEINDSGESNFVNALTGKVAGLQIANNRGSVGASSRIVLRGNSSLSGSNEPLYVVDGVPLDNSSFVGLDNNRIRNLPNGLSELNPKDIESVNVIKGPRAGALYGMRGTNGVIVITTKSGRRSGNNFLGTSNNNNNNNNENRIVTPIRNGYKGKLKVKLHANNETYIKELEKATSLEDAYAMYLNQRSTYSNLPAYYIDVYDYFKKWNNKDIGLRILTNIAEMDFANYELLRVFAYKLEETNNYGLASFIYNQVLKLRPEDAQSYRDLALAYHEVGFKQESFNLFNSILDNSIYKNNNRRKFAGMQRIVENEINQLLQNSTEIEKEKLEKIKERETAFDIRIVIDWNHNDTDIDLHIIDPFLEECFYSHPKTIIGGEISQDMTQGFGPEEFTLRNAKKGAYYVKINYFGDRYQKLENPTFMKVTMFRNFGKVNQTKEIQVIRLTKRRDNQIVAKLIV